jgi:hypothetical protein
MTASGIFYTRIALLQFVDRFHNGGFGFLAVFAARGQ